MKMRDAEFLKEYYDAEENNFANRKIDDVRIYERSLTKTEVSKLYDEENPTKENDETAPVINLSLIHI